MATATFEVGDGSFHVYDGTGFEMVIDDEEVYRYQHGQIGCIRVGESDHPKDAVELVKLMAGFLGYRLEPEVISNG